MRVLFLNQYFPPDPAPTGLLFGEIAEELRARGHEVICASSGQEYRAGQKMAFRWVREAFALVRMFFVGIWQKRVDLVVSGSSPPCLAFVGALVALRHWRPHLHWCMDLYPDIAIALKEIRSPRFAGMMRWLMKRAYRSAHTVIVLDADMSEKLRGYGVESLECRPWVTGAVLATLPVPAPAPAARPWTWLYSGNLGRAHDWQTLLAAQAELETRGVDATLVFQGGGPQWDAAQTRAAELGLRNVQWRDYVPENQLCARLLHSHCLVATQLPAVRGLLWPSKLALMLGLPRPILCVGPNNGAIATLLKPRPRTGIFAPGDFAAVARWVEERRAEESTLRETDSTDAVRHRRESLAWWVESIERFQGRKA
jgi:glycosyltransferase involved in cell wall biosynthesis